jgi:hypothetical protein
MMAHLHSKVNAQTCSFETALLRPLFCIQNFCEAIHVKSGTGFVLSVINSYNILKNHKIHIISILIPIEAIKHIFPVDYKRYL